MGEGPSKDADSLAGPSSADGHRLFRLFQVTNSTISVDVLLTFSEVPARTRNVICTGQSQTKALEESVRDEETPCPPRAASVWTDDACRRGRCGRADRHRRHRQGAGPPVPVAEC